MRILVNATTLVVGGGIQVGVSFIEYALRRPDSEGHSFLFAVSDAVHGNLTEQERQDPRVLRFPVSPARIVRGFRSRSALRKLEHDFKPDVVYSVGSPSYTTFRAPEIARFTWPWGTHPSPLAWSSLPSVSRQRRRLERRYKLWRLRKVPYFETQTSTAADGIIRNLSVEAERVRVIPNALSLAFDAGEPSPLAGNTDDGDVRILTLAAPYPHKNLGIIPEIAAILQREAPATRARFIVTLPEGSEAKMDFMRRARALGVEDRIENVGRVALRDCPDLYRGAHIVLLPTLLETFSVTYLEAMRMGVPIVTTDLDFAREVCGKAALYYDPLSAEAAAAAIECLVKDPGLRAELVEAGRARLGEFPSWEEKNLEVLQWILEVAAKSSHGRD